MKPPFEVRVFLVLSQLCVSILGASILASANAADLELFNSSCGAIFPNPGVGLPVDPSPPIPVKDYINGEYVDSTTSLIFKNFDKPKVAIDPRNLFDLVGKAQYDIVKAVVANHGDGVVTPYNFQWRHGATYLRINHQIDDRMTWSMMSRAVKGISDWGWNEAFIATQVIVLDGMVEVGTGQLGLGFTTAADNITTS